MSARDAVKAREDARKPQRPKPEAKPKGKKELDPALEKEPHGDDG